MRSLLDPLCAVNGKQFELSTSKTAGMHWLLGHQRTGKKRHGSACRYNCTTVKLFTRMLCNLNVCVYVIFIRCDRRTSDNKHKKKSQNLVGNN